METSCRIALKLLNMDEDAPSSVIATAHYFTGLAREMGGDRRGAAEAFVTALRYSPGPPGYELCEMALARVSK